MRIEAAREYRVAPSQELTAALAALFGEGCCRMAEDSAGDSECPDSGTRPFADGSKEGVDLP